MDIFWKFKIKEKIYNKIGSKIIKQKSKIFLRKNEKLCQDLQNDWFQDNENKKGLSKI